MKSKRQMHREKLQKQRRNTTIVWSGLGVVILIGLGYLIWNATRPAQGEAVTIMLDTSHVPEGTDPGPFNSDPPTSGRHYANTYEVGFYDSSSPEAQAEYPDGYLVHNLEHGYVIFWYNCSLLDDQSCEELKSDIRSVMETVDHFKVIAFPRPNLDVPVVMTSWGQMMRFERFNTRQAEDFVLRNRNKAPEPQAS